MNHTLYIDLETKSRVDLTKSNVYRYSEDPDFEILIAAWAIDDGPVLLATGHDEISKIPGLFDPSYEHVAHNASFERICLSRLAGLPVGAYLPPSQWLDTMAIAAELGLPASLDGCAKALGGEQKDHAGVSLIKFFSIPQRDGSFHTPEDDPEKWASFCRYCLQDVETLRSIHRKMGGFPTEKEREIYNVDQEINDAGIHVDMELTRAAVEASELNQILGELRISQLTGIENPGSVAQMKSWLATQGVEMASLSKAAVEDKLNDNETPELVRKVLELRQGLALVAAKKFTTIESSVSSDDRLRGQFRFFGAHTGRWSGKGVQLHNLPRAGFHSDDETELAILDLITSREASPHDLKALVRSTFLGPMIVCDFSAIEARVIAWLAGEQWVLDAFAAGRDIYAETANRMGGGLTRREGKIAVLALGYAGGVGSLRAMGGEDLGPDAYLGKLVKQWRAANPHIVELWSRMDEAFWYGGAVGDHLYVERSGRDRSVHLPSGRSIVYRGLKRSTEESEFGPRTVMTFAGARGRTKTYGGRLTENATQAVARDVLAEAMVRMTDAGLRIVGHVHDEVLVEKTEPGQDLAMVKGLMTMVPSWAAGLPVDAAGFEAPRYKKD